ncbi:hypothetical protein [Nocardioides flavescens]|uniref:ARB-07466-like C-terminal domain-containing protein n=1 Tax=Nocardioides flavescens TaxID=2691959 RepID=A0A6L7EZG1_9ACTN|nr:hypothetical protein [Nocardioides flavescens]
MGLTGLVVLTLLGAVGWWVVRSGLGGGVVPFLASDQCEATVEGRTVVLDPEQAQNAGLITAIAVQRGMPARAASIALATAYQESDLRNLDHGDRDSLGLFQQRPSQGWGTPEQVQDPTYATNAFYDELAEVADYRQLEITVAAQLVQRSAYPDAYADHEADARVLASALTGNSKASFSCRVGGDWPETSARLEPSGLTERADRVRTELAELFPDQPQGGFAPGGVSTGHIPGSAHYEGRAVDVFVRPVNAVNKTRGWAIAAYAVSQAERWGVRTVIFDGRIWTAGVRSGQGWRDYQAPDRPGDRAILEHRDHVHVDVAP